ncbi:transcription initiation factor IIE subunit beta [Lepeophtheirus salmonis]|uniref:transcription initiation factor IIE subunit beta n=1 Tax=Lepeophtheirus salmonis TaxID=72036 RepID=UPI001AE371CB|nr:transcription initiation factor IIE subunit beta-like [Lepeophtheirus salmonis]
MDRALLREREAFKNRAMAVPVVENKKLKKNDGSAAERKAKKIAETGGGLSKSAKSKFDMQQYRAASAASGASPFGGYSGASSTQFSVLAKIVRHMKTRHMDGEDHPLTLEEILDETNQLDVSSRTKNWLFTEALKNNPKIEVKNGTYIFKAPYNVTSKKTLIKLLKHHDLKGLGGIFLEDLAESLPKCDKIIRNLLDDEKIVIISRSADRKKVVFLLDPSVDIQVDEEFRKLWRSVAVEGTDDAKIAEYLEKQGIRSMADNGIKKVFTNPRMRKKAIKRKARAPKDNEHMKDILEDYNELTSSSHFKQT